LGRNQIEAKAGSRGSVSREIARFRATYEEKGWLAAGGEYQVEEKLEELIEIAKIARNRNISPTEMADGAEVAEALKRNQIDDPKESKRFIDSVLKLGKDEGFDSQKIIDSCSEIIQLKKEYGNFGEIRLEWETIGKGLPSRKAEIAELEGTVKTRKRELNSLNQEYSVTEKSLQDYLVARAGFKGFGLNMESDLDDALQVIQNLKDSEFKPKSVLSELKQNKTLKSRILELNKEVEEKTRKTKEISQSIEAGETELGEKQKILKAVHTLNATGLSVEDIQKLRDTVVKISAKHGMNSQKAIEHFSNDILQNYDSSLGLGTKNVFLKGEMEKVQKEAKQIAESNRKAGDDAQIKLDAVNSECTKKENELAAYISLRARGVTDKTIWRFSVLLKRSSSDDILETVKELADLDNLKSKRIEEVRQIEERKIKSSTELTAIGTEKSKIEASISELRNAGVKELNKLSNSAIDNMNRATETAKSTVESSVSRLTSSLSGLSSNLSSLETSIRKQRELVEKSIQETTDKNDKSDAAVITNINRLEEKILNFGSQREKYGKYLALVEFADSGKGDKKEIFSSVLVVTDKLVRYTEPDRKLWPINTPAKNLRNALQDASGGST